MSSATERYREFRDRINGLSEGLEQLHCRHLACKPGCHDCCVNLTVFPVEYYAILEDLQRLDRGQLELNEGASCAFLRQGLCTIYAVRPTICRTHGLPIAFVNQDTDEPEINVSFCPRNFTKLAGSEGAEGTEGEDLAFGPDNTLDLDELNMELSELNRQFLEEHPELGFKPADRIPLLQLASDLQGPQRT